MTSKVIAVTGGIGSGKSETTRYLQGLGYNTLDCDTLAREVSFRPCIVEQVRKLLGDIFVVDGQLDRAAIRNKVFGNEDLLNRYNALFFDEVKKILDEEISVLIRQAEAANQEGIVVFVEISVFDAFEYPWDEVWLVEADVETRINRAQIRDRVSRKSLDDIVARQRVCNGFTRKLTNDGVPEDLYKQIDIALAEFVGK